MTFCGKETDMAMELVNTISNRPNNNKIFH